MHGTYQVCLLGSLGSMHVMHVFDTDQTVSTVRYDMEQEGREVMGRTVHGTVRNITHLQHECVQLLYR